jgi:hypothetical protein
MIVDNDDPWRWPLQARRETVFELSLFAVLHRQGWQRRTLI